MTLNTFKQERLLIVLVLLTLTLPLLQRFGLDRVFVVNSETVHAVSVLDDRSSGGGSKAELSLHGAGSQLDCNLSDLYQWRYCELLFQLQEDNQPVDLSRYSFIRLFIKSSGPGPQKLKIYLRNDSPEYTQVGDDFGLKVNEIQYDPNKHPYPFDVPLENFIVSQWWLNARGASPLLANREMDSIVLIDVATGDDRLLGKHVVEVERIEFHGKWLNLREILSLMVLMWLGYAFYSFFLSIRTARREVYQANMTKKVLQDINSTLSLEKVELEVQANRDALTGVYNRAGLSQFLVQLYSSFQRHGHTFSVVFMDIDHFKTVNDEHGHDVGDQVLKQFAELISQETREEDILGRWGGEEFILLCPHTNLSSTQQLAEKLRQSVEDHIWPNDLKITSSFGLAEVHLNEDVSSLIRRADSALYQAKDDGRNRVVKSL